MYVQVQYIHLQYCTSVSYLTVHTYLTYLTYLTYPYFTYLTYLTYSVGTVCTIHVQMQKPKKRS